MKHASDHVCCGLTRRDLLQTLGTTAAVISLGSDTFAADSSSKPAQNRTKRKAHIKGAFLYPPTESLRKEGYYSWPGSSFDAEGHQKNYLQHIKQIEHNLDMLIEMENKPLDEASEVTRFINQVKKSPPDGLLLIPFKKGHWPLVTRIIKETKIPTVVLATLGVLLVGHINQLHHQAGVYLISAQDDLDAVARGMKMIRTAHWMNQARLLNIYGSSQKDSYVQYLGTQMHTIPHQRFLDEYLKLETTQEVKKLADTYKKNAREIVQPSSDDIIDAAKTYFALKRLLAAEKADALMMDCLPGLKIPHKHPPPCMGFMSLRDEGIVAGCQSDLNATLTMMLVQQLFDKPGFQQNASMNTEKNLYFGAHCTSPSKMKGVNEPAEPYSLMSHAEAGWGCVPRVLYSPGQKVTLALYLTGEKPRMHIYSGEVVSCPAIPPTGGCRSNIEMTINEVDDVCDVKGMHQTIFYGDYARQLRTFCQLYNIEVVT